MNNFIHDSHSHKLQKVFFTVCNLYLHILRLDPIAILLENLRQLWISSLEKNHENIEPSKETKGWFTRPDDLGEGPMSREWRFVTHITVPMGTEDTGVAEWNNYLGFHL